MYDISGFVIKMCKSFRYFLENVAPDYMTVQSRKYHEVNDFIQIFGIEIPFFGCSPKQYDLLFVATFVLFAQ